MSSYLDGRRSALAGFSPATRAQLARERWGDPPSRGLVVFYGHPQTVRLAHCFLARPLLAGRVVLFLDAANCFNPYLITSLARRAGAAQAQGEFLRRVQISRAFTCYQLSALIERTAGVLASFGAQHVLLTGFPDIFDDDDVADREAKRVLEQALARLVGLGRRAAVWVFSDQAADSEARRSELRREVMRRAARVYRLEERKARLELRLESKSSPPWPVTTAPAGLGTVTAELVPSPSAGLRINSVEGLVVSLSNHERPPRREHGFRVPGRRLILRSPHSTVPWSLKPFGSLKGPESTSFECRVAVLVGSTGRSRAEDHRVKFFAGGKENKR